MFQLKKFEFKANEISGLLKMPLIGKDIIVNNVQKLGEETDNSIIMCYPKNKELLSNITKNCLVFCAEDTVIQSDNLSFIVTPNPKYTFFNFINEFLIRETTYWYENIISSCSDKYPGVVFGYNVKVGYNVIIAPKTVIGSNVLIGNNVIIRSNVSIGDSCIIKDNTVVGSEGFGYMKTDEGLEHIPQLGYVSIGNNVIIGSNCTIEKPALGKTVLKDNVKVDDLIQIGHNVEIGENTIITTGFKAEGGVKIGSDTFIGMGVVIISSKVSIGNNCLVGAGSVITKSIPDNKMVYGTVTLNIKDVGSKRDDILKTPYYK